MDATPWDMELMDLLRRHVERAGPGSVSQSDYVACVTEAVGCGCYDYENPAAVCGNELLIGPPAMCVLDTTNLEAVALSFGNLFCVGAVDAGPDAAPPHDAAGHG
jgi:hypothetical protein